MATIRGDQLKSAPLQSIQSRSKGLLGSLLLNQQLVTRKQLKRAIEYQCHQGGRLGTCLLELDFIEEERLTKALNDQWQRPYFPPSALMNIPASILQTISTKTALHYKVLPFKRERSILYLAVSNCRQPSLFKQLSELTTCKVIPILFTEARLSIALSIYFSHPLPCRYEQLAIILNKRSQHPQQLTRQKDTIQQAMDNNSANNAARPKSKEITDAQTHHNQAQTSIYPTEAALYQNFRHSLVGSKNREDIIEALHTYLGYRSINSAFFTVKDNFLCSWTCSRTEMSSDFAKFKAQFDQFPILTKVIDQRLVHYGVLPQELNRIEIRQIFNNHAQSTFFIAPIILKNRTIAILCLELQPGIIEGQLQLKEKICQNLELAFQQLIIRNKILTDNRDTHE